MYFPEWRAVIDSQAPSKENWRLALTLSSEDGVTVAPYGANLTLPLTVKEGYEAISAPVTDAAGSICGRALLDVRTLDAEGFARDLQEKGAWTPDKERAFARELAELASQYINTSFGEALLVFQKSAATPDGLTAPLERSTPAKAADHESSRPRAA
jgi:hypothetical protein